MDKQVKHGFKPVIDNQCQILILGSMPSVQSRAGSFYYLHPQNRFWRVLTALFNLDFVSAGILQKQDLLLKLHIALYDVIDSCQITGSADSSIKNVKPINLEALLKLAPIKQIYLNGSKAYTLFKKHFPARQSMAMPLLSTSAASARYSLVDLINQWSCIKKNLN
ncbi:MAG: DNA-deoxyinosine glycosylase [Candidatus Izemoplasmatales bacterium]|jgi:hypoxanthine-DNA glycosylase|nr:DNA-deoxyinosine glycosylase [Candidatus Izemoplasmatales bacterium]MDD4595877.1 DNA-deoxyinosine glycosylase [Candidatus Izemoplasmatales bacterium]